MPRIFNVAGPNQPEHHYTLPATARLPGVRDLIDEGLYFVLHAPRPVGKTTSLLGLGKELTAEGAYVALLVSMEVWREHGEPLLRTAPYHEVAPHLVMMAYLHRVVNGGSIEREYAIGSGRMDLCLRYAGETLAIEIKVWRPGRPDPLAQGLAQLDRYLAGLGLDEGWLVIFDRRPGLPPVEERLATSREKSPGGRRVVVIRA